MEEVDVNMFSLGCGNCDICPYRIRCKEYTEYIKFSLKREEDAENERV